MSDSSHNFFSNSGRVLRLSTFPFVPSLSPPKDETSLNAKLLVQAGFIRKLQTGVYSFLPLGLRVLNKIEEIVRSEMRTLGSFEVLLPALHPREIWEQTGRWSTVDVLYKMKGHGDRDLCLGPTHEEVITPLVGEFCQTYKKLPVSVFQIQTKFRNELRPRSGLLRCREFRMKDLYSFHTSHEDLESFYEKVTASYFSIFSKIGLKDNVFLTYASGGVFSEFSHEFQALCDNGEDTIYVDFEKKIAINDEIFAQVKDNPQFKNCNFQQVRAIEVGNIFKLGDKFSSSFNYLYVKSDSQQAPVLMGCYGIGTSRLVGALAEIYSDQHGLNFPVSVSPAELIIVPLIQNETVLNDIVSLLIDSHLDVIVDDRDVGPGHKFKDADLMGIPFRLTVGNRTISNGVLDVKSRATGATKDITVRELKDLVIAGKFSKWLEDLC
ncbi:MAG: His/Gly/Thr/Pro-type tRNA ligase C-terminal domain-containing protein [Deltaproteobacteria bacterium]|nr:His/Gly/Thr/Pro-type tRNA ligase C-terminal domain-containing protein [Deltaproteobacteria bacterium]